MEMTVQIEGDSEEAVAFALLQMVAQAEGKLAADGALTGVDREWILDTYAECRMAVEGARPFDVGQAVVDEHRLTRLEGAGAATAQSRNGHAGPIRRSDNRRSDDDADG
jgi:hypothetical protein